MQVQIICEKPAKPDPAPHDNPARSGGRPCIKVVQQNQRADCNHHREESADLVCQLEHLREGSGLRIDRDQDQLEQLDKDEDDNYGPRGLEAFIPPIGCEQVKNDHKKRNIARCLRYTDCQRFRVRGKREAAPHDTRRERYEHGFSIGAIAIAELRNPYERPRRSDCPGKIAHPRQHGFKACETCQNQRAPSGQRITRTVCSRITKSRNGV